MPRCILLTIATHRNVWLDDWEKSANFWNYRYEILGMGKPWEGFETKINLIIDKTTQLPSDNLICIVDSYDLIMAGSKSELVEKFLSKGKKIVVGSESVCGPNCVRTGIAVENNNKPHINGGFVMGYSGEINKLYRNILRLCPYDDQIGIAKYIMTHPDLFHIDSNQDLVLNLNYGSEIHDLERVENRRFRYKPTGTNPVVIHTPFIQKDLGTRSNYVRVHALENYEEISQSQFLLEFVKHIRIHMSNPAYKELSIIVSTSFVIIIIVIILTIYGLFKYSKK